MLNSQIISQVRCAFVNKCIVLVGNAYDDLRAIGIVNHDMDENTVSENLKRLMCRNSLAKSNGILIAREQSKDDGSLLTSNQSADSLPRIDFQFQTSWSWEQKQCALVFYMEAKNLYANNFIKTGNSNKTFAKANHKRYVNKGITHLLNGYYPPNTILLGYLLEGTVSDAVAGVNIQVSSMLSQTEVLNQVQPLYPSISTYVSCHSENKKITHLMLQF